MFRKPEQASHGRLPLQEKAYDLKLRFYPRDLSSQTDLFYRVIESYQKHTKGHHLPPDFDIRKAHNWDEVHQAARLAETKHKKDGTRSIFGKIGRGIQRSAPAVEPWLGLIPDGDYTSVLCGGLKIAFRVRSHKSALRAFHVSRYSRSRGIYTNKESRSSKRSNRSPKLLGSPRTVWRSGRTTKLFTMQRLNYVLLSWSLSKL